LEINTALPAAHEDLLKGPGAFIEVDVKRAIQEGER
jgi:hypothetical protein